MLLVNFSVKSSTFRASEKALTAFIMASEFSSFVFDLKSIKKYLPHKKKRIEKLKWIILKMMNARFMKKTRSLEKALKQDKLIEKRFKKTFNYCEKA